MELSECKAQFQNEHYEVLKSLFISPRVRTNENTFDLGYAFSYELGPMENNENIIKGAVKLDVKCYPEEKGVDATIIDTTLFGVFNGKGFEEERFKELLELNGLTFLMQIARTHIISMTSMAGCNPIVMPMINVHDLIKKHNEAR